MTNTIDSIDAVLASFRTYQPKDDRSSVIEPKFLFENFSSQGDETESASISSFASILRCPYRIVNVGAGSLPKFSRETIARMNKGTVAHKTVEDGVRAKATASIKQGGPPDLLTATDQTRGIADQDLLEAPEVNVQLAIDSLKLRGKVDGLLRHKSVVIAIERKPRSAMFKPASRLQAMTYAIGGCLQLKSEQASTGANWMVTGYEGEGGPSGRITQDACNLLIGIGNAYSQLIRFGADGHDVPGLYGPRAGKCSSCEFFAGCKYRNTEPKAEHGSSSEPIWMKYAKRRGGKAE